MELEQYIRGRQGELERLDEDSVATLAKQASAHFRKTGDISYINLAIHASQRLRAISSSPSSLAIYLSNLGIYFKDKYYRTAELVDLDEAIKAARESVDLSAPDHAIDQVSFLNNLGNHLEARFDCTGNMANLEEALQIARQIVGLTPDESPRRAWRINDLANKLGTKYQQTRHIHDLEEAIGFLHQAVKPSPVKETENQPERQSGWAACLSNLANKLWTRYECTGNFQDLEESIRTMRKAVDATPEDHANYPTMLNNLGNALQKRYERMGQLSDLKEAIFVSKRTISASSHSQLVHAAFVSNHGVKLQRLYQRTGQMADLEEAINITKETIDSVPETYLEKVTWMVNLANMLELRYEVTGHVDDVNEAISMTRQAIALTSNDHLHRAARYANLGSKLEKRYLRTSEETDLQESIQTMLRVLQLSPEAHSQRAAWLNHLGVKLLRRYELHKDTADLNEAASQFQKAWDCVTATPLHRIVGAARCVILLPQMGNALAAINLGKSVIDLLPSVNTRLLDQADQQQILKNYTEVAANLCSLLLQANQTSEALEYLEKGRAVIIGQLLDSRSDLSELEPEYQHIAQRYRQLVKELSEPAPQAETSTGVEQMRERRVETLAELDACIQEIRSIKGHNRFLLGQEPSEFMDCAAGGFIVVINVTFLRSDAIIVSPHAIKAIHLPRLLHKDAVFWLSKKWKGLSREIAQKNEEHLEYLSWLWTTSVRDILDEVAKLHHAEDLPRIWWIGSGIASSMPFHAAGTHALGSTENTFDRAVSSYTASIKALSYSRRRAQDTKASQGSLLFAMMPKTPFNMNFDAKRYGDLRKVHDEKALVTSIASGCLSIKTLETPTVAQVQTALQMCSVAHFACHGYSDHSDPSNSGLVFQGGNQNQPRQDYLTMRAVSDLSLPNGRLAYLSACSTAETRAERLSDEVLHVVNGFQLAGFPHVVGCLWNSNDRVCKEVAEKFYSTLLGRKGASWNDGDVALALREGVMLARADDIGMPLNWAPFVHYGA